MAPLAEESMEEVKDIICDILEIDSDEVTQTSLFKEEHDADSLRAIEILASLEKKFGVSIDQAELSRMVNLEGVYTVLTESMARR